LKATNLVRESLAAGGFGGVPLRPAEFLTAGDELPEPISRGPDPIPVFGIRETGGKVEITVIEGMTPGEVLALDVRKIREGTVVYTDRWKDYESLIYCGFQPSGEGQKKIFSGGNVAIGRVGGFWSYARERLAKFRGISKEFFPFYLKEIEFRYNYRDKEIFEILADSICRIVPNNL
jgi:transposase-like protein